MGERKGNGVRRKVTGFRAERRGEGAVGNYGDAEGYHRYMGGWSAALSPPFLDFAGRDGLSDVLDVGCGTGNLMAELGAAHPDAVLTGIDPSQALLTKARERPELGRAVLIAGGVEAMPFAAGRFSHVLSMLVLQEFADRDGALAEMRRVRRGQAASLRAANGILRGCRSSRRWSRPSRRSTRRPAGAARAAGIAGVR